MDKLLSLIRFESILALLFIGGLVLLYYGEHEPVVQEISELRSRLDHINFLKGDSLALPDASFRELELRIDKLELKFDQKQNILMKYAPISIFALLLFYWGIYKVALNFAVEAAKKDVAMSYRNEETIFREEKKILVLTKTGASTEFMQRFFNKSGFEQHEILESFESLPDPDRKFDLFFINNEDKYESEDKKTRHFFTDSEIKTFMGKCKPTTIIFNFGKQVNDPDVSGDERFTSAMFRSQLLGNLMNAFRYQKVLR